MNTQHTLSAFVRDLFSSAPPAAQPIPARPDMLVTPDAARCVQCGVCVFNCPVGIAVRDFAHQGRVVDDPRCVQCGQCIEVCPRGTLRWAASALPAGQLRPGLAAERRPNP